MPSCVHVGCCGWSYLNEKEFHELYNSGRRHSKLQAYAKLFDTVEINSTFYKLPRLSTAEKWRKEVDEINPGFEFSVKAYKGITHLHRFQKKESVDSYRALKDICGALSARVILFQSPASFNPSQANIETIGEFFYKIDRKGIVPVWEARGKWYDDIGLIEKVCHGSKLVHCVDPFRNDPVAFGKEKIAYFRLHGFGKPTMYHYSFSADELRLLSKKISSLPDELEDIYVLFNNDSCYANALAFKNVDG